MNFLNNKNIEDIFSITKTLDTDGRDYLDDYFANAPMRILESFQVVDYPKNHIFIKENETISIVHILVDGVVRGIDYRIYGVAYNFMWFYAVETFGAMEILIDCDVYKTTLETVTPCKFFTIPIKIFKEWMTTDINALLMQTNKMVNYLLEQARKERIFLFTQGSERVFILLMTLYEKETLTGDVCIINLTREELADLAGLSVKTINRSVKKLTTENYITRDGHKILINEEQYLKMKFYLSEKIYQ